MDKIFLSGSFEWFHAKFILYRHNGITPPYHTCPIYLCDGCLLYWVRTIQAEAIHHRYKEYDYVIVGGGAASSVLAYRLSEDKDKTVLLLEAGGNYDENPAFLHPINWFAVQHTKHDWGYYTEPQEFSNYGFNERRSFWPRRRVLGGSATVNAVQYFRGSKFDYDEWASNGCSGWSFKDVLPYFLKSEDIQIQELKDSNYHSVGGPIAVSHGRVTSLADKYLQAGRELGYKVIEDYVYNDNDDPDGFIYIQLMIRHGVRSNAGVEYLQNTAERENLHIAINSFVTKIAIKDKQAEGVYVVRDGRKSFISAKKRSDYFSWRYQYATVVNVKWYRAKGTFSWKRYWNSCWSSSWTKSSRPPAYFHEHKNKLFHKHNWENAE